LSWHSPPESDSETGLTRPYAGPGRDRAGVRPSVAGVESVTDDEIRDGIALLARTEGIFAETAGGVTVATLKKLVEAGRLDPEAETVVFNTGDGLKTLDAIAGEVGPTATIASSYDAFEAAGLG